MIKAAAALTEHNQRLLEFIQLGAEQTRLPELMQARGKRIQALASALAAGGTLSAEEVQLLCRLERELQDSLQRRRDDVAHELSALHRARRAEKTYHPAEDREPRFVDCSG